MVHLPDQQLSAVSIQQTLQVCTQHSRCRFGGGGVVQVQAVMEVRAPYVNCRLVYW